MRSLAVWALTLTGCASMHGPLDVITPDELTVGRGNATGVINGGYTGHHDMFEYEGETDSTSIALTWNLPSFAGDSDGMDRETRRNLSLLIDQMVEEEVAAEDDDSDSMFVLADGAKAPPVWLPFALIGTAAIIILGFALRSKRKDQW